MNIHRKEDYIHLLKRIRYICYSNLENSPKDKANDKTVYMYYLTCIKSDLSICLYICLEKFWKGTQGNSWRVDESLEREMDTFFIVLLKNFYYMHCYFQRD